MNLGNHIFDTKLKKKRPLNAEKLLICGSIGIPDDELVNLNLHSPNDNNKGNDYIEC